MNASMPWRAWLRQQWFWPATALLVALDLLVVKRLSAGAEPWLIEAGLLSDWCITAPLLYLLCFRRDGKRAVLRAVGLACLGFWLASQLLPTRDGGLIDQLAPLRYLGLGVLFLIEMYVMCAVYGAIFRGGSVDDATDDLQSKLGMPRWAARWVALEAAFWRRAGASLKRWWHRR